jgi:epoxyqueuosine reductase
MQLTRTRSVDFRRLANDIKCWGRALGFQQVGIAGVELGAAEARLLNWLAAGRQGEMHYMAAHGTRRSRPPALLPGTTRVISDKPSCHALSLVMWRATRLGATTTS